MPESTAELAIRKSLTVGVPVETAFRVFTEEMGSWWPLASKSVSQEEAETVVVEARVGGRVYERARTGDALRRAYDLVVFPGHEEYVTGHVYGVMRRYRDLGGRLMFLSANNVFWKVKREGQLLRRVALWRTLGRPEASLVGVQWAASNYDPRRSPYVVQGTPAVSWAFTGTGLRTGSSFGRYGIEIDARAPSSPPGTKVLARMPRAIGRHAAEMTYYETASGARVFAAGVVNFAASINNSVVSRLVQNVWARLAR